MFIICVFIFVAACEAKKLRYSTNFKRCENNNIKSVGRYSTASFNLDGNALELKVWDNRYSQQYIETNNPYSYISVDSVADIDGGILWTGSYQGSIKGKPSQGVFYRKNDIVHQVYSATDGRILINNNSAIILSHKDLGHEGVGELLFLGINKKGVFLNEVMSLPGKPADFIHLGNDRYIISGFSQPNKSWAFLLHNKKNMQNLDCGVLDTN